MSHTGAAVLMGPAAPVKPQSCHGLVSLHPCSSASHILPLCDDPWQSVFIRGKNSPFIRVHPRFKSCPSAIIPGNPRSSVANTVPASVFIRVSHPALLRLSVVIRVHPWQKPSLHSCSFAFQIPPLCDYPWRKQSLHPWRLSDLPGSHTQSQTSPHNAHACENLCSANH